MDEHPSFGAWIQRRRKALDLTQAELAEQVGCALGTIRKIETDERRPSKQIAARLAEQLQLAPEERALFLKAARAEVGVNRLAPPTRLVRAKLPADFPRLSTLDPHRTNLLLQPTALIGREREVADEATFAAAWEAGRALSLEQAIVEAMAEAAQATVRPC